MKEIEKPTFVHAKNQTPKKQNDIVIGEIQGLKKRDLVKWNFLKKHGLRNWALRLLQWIDNHKALALY